MLCFPCFTRLGSSPSSYALSSNSKSNADTSSSSPSSSGTGGFVGPGYGHPTPDGLRAGRLLARTEAVFLDPVYTGKAMAGLLDLIRSGQIGEDEVIVFVHTGGGPSLFAHGAALLE